MTDTRPSLLVVDDSRTTRDMFASLLASRGYNVRTVGSGPEAVDLLAKEPFDLVLLDVEMPNMNGLEVLSIIRQTHSIGELPVIMVTGRKQSGDMIAAFQLGASDYVTKPLNPAVALARIQAQTAIRLARAGAPKPTGRELVSVAAKGSSSGAPITEKAAVAAPLRESAGEHAARGAVCTEETQGDQRRNARTLTDRLVVAGYEVLGELGRGGMGVVYKARHQRMNRLVALKVIDKEYMANPDTVRRFYKEAEAIAQLCHPNIVLAYDAGEFNDTHYLAMEYIDGIDLARLVKQSGPLPVQQACDYLRQAALGLQHANEQGLVHRDIKPSNLLVTPLGPAGSNHPEGALSGQGGVVKVLDLGMALLVQPVDPSGNNTSLTTEGRVVGTVDYMAPEQWVNAHKVDIRADLYSLGCTLYYLLAGRVPFPGEEAMQKMLKHHLDEPTPLEKLRSDVPPEVTAVVRRLMAKRPEERYKTPADLVEVLK
jgi:serine/threonine-protein kinase